MKKYNDTNTKHTILNKYTLDYKNLNVSNWYKN